MQKNNKYKINYHLLKEGKSSLEYDIDSEFFGLVEDSEIYGGECKATIELQKGLSLLKMSISIVGTVKVDCDRCLEEVTIPINYEGTLIVKITHAVEEYEFVVDDKGEDTIMMNPSVEDMDLSEYLYDSIILSLPMQRVHTGVAGGEGGCNPDMMNRFTIITNESDIDLNDDDYDDDDEDDGDDDALLAELLASLKKK